MPKSRSKVTLDYTGVGGLQQGAYRVKQIAGSTPTVHYVKKGELMAGVPMVARVGSILSELEAEGLGKVADLIVKPGVR